MNNQPRRGRKNRAPRAQLDAQIVDLHSEDQTLPIVDSRGRVTIPRKVRSAVGLRPGDRIDFVEIEKGQFAIIPITGSIKALGGKFRGRRTKPASFEEMDAAIAKGVSRSR
jgi:antitoxin PrlF